MTTVAADHGLDAAIDRAVRHLLSRQHPDGHWVGELFADVTLCADLAFFLHWSGQDEDPLLEKCAGHIRERQLPDGGWNIYEGGPSEINASVKAYTALRLAGDAEEAPWLREAAANILRLGGIPRMNTYGKLYLALMGQYPWPLLPAVPVELVLLPAWSPFNLHELSAWTRAIVVPLAVIHHAKAAAPRATTPDLSGLFPAGGPSAADGPGRTTPLLSWRNFFLVTNSLLKLYDRRPIGPLRRLALRRAEEWMLARMGPESEGLAAIYPAMLNALIALRCLGRAPGDPVYDKAWSDFRSLLVEDSMGFRIQPCLSPVWDTAITSLAVSASSSGAAAGALEQAGRWLLDREVRQAGDWSARLPGVEPSGWAFEYRNAWYPDVDDTAMVLLALLETLPDDPAAAAARQRGLAWLRAMQCREGGWAAFDRDITNHWLEHVPFADHNAILDPPCSDLTTRVLEILGRTGAGLSDPAVRRAVDFLFSTQEDDGSWGGRWGVHYVYGTSHALRGLAAAGVAMNAPAVQRAVRWLESCQNDDGGWGESCAAYEDPRLKGRGRSTPSQTAWALLGLMPAGRTDSAVVQRGVQHLVTAQDEDGSWQENSTTGTGFPRVFYLKYDMYRLNWPLLALAEYRRHSRAGHQRGR